MIANAEKEEFVGVLERGVWVGWVSVMSLALVCAFVS